MTTSQWNFQLGGNVAEFSRDMLVLTVWQDQRPTKEVLDTLGNRKLVKLCSMGKFSGNKGEVKTLYFLGNWEQIIILGLGKRDKFNPEAARECGAALVEKIDYQDVKKVGIIGDWTVPKVPKEQILAALAEGIILGAYKFDKYRTNVRQRRSNPSLHFLGEKSEVLDEAVRKGVVLAEAVNSARDLVNEPANYLTPVELASRARKLANQYGLGYKELGFQEIRQLRMGGVLAVGKGAENPPRVILLSYQGQQEKQAMAFVGKGITFDAGGISLKQARGMEAMKSDMAGGAAVIGAMVAIAGLQPKINICGIIPTAENMPDGSAYKPGDVVTMMNGNTVEIVNTDAEGRLLLADGITYAVKHDLSPIIDIATLSAACSIALGPIYSGLWSNSQRLKQEILSASQQAGEKLWPMPYDEEYLTRIKGGVADLKNVGGGDGGASVAASFLGQFAGESPWAHVDIAPTGFADNAMGYIKKGGTGVGVRTLARLACRLAEHQLQYK